MLGNLDLKLSTLCGCSEATSETCGPMQLHDDSLAASNSPPNKGGDRRRQTCIDTITFALQTCKKCMYRILWNKLAQAKCIKKHHINSF